jgi:hypothetical protein
MNWNSKLFSPIGLLAAAALAAGQARALDPVPAIDLSGQGYSIAEGGAGIGGDSSPRTLPVTLSVEIGGPVVQAVLYWGGFMSDGVSIPGDAELSFDGVPLTGALTGTEVIGGGFVTQAFGYAAEVTDLVQASFTAGGGPGTYDFAIDDANPADDSDRFHGVGLLVIYSDPDASGEFRIIVFEGADYAYDRFAGTINGETEPVEFLYDAAAADRGAQFVFFGGGGEEGRTERLSISDNPDILDNADSSDGEQWDTDSFEINIPAGVDSTVAQFFSEGPNSDSLFWVVGGLRIPLEEPPDSPLACTPGFWKNRAAGKQGLLKFFPGDDFAAVVAEAVALSNGVFAGAEELVAAVSNQGTPEVQARRNLAALLLNLAAGNLFPGNGKCQLFEDNEIDENACGEELSVADALEAIFEDLGAGYFVDASECADDINNNLGLVGAPEPEIDDDCDPEPESFTASSKPNKKGKKGKRGKKGKGKGKKKGH